ncbi:ABC transporter permease [Aquimarina spongiae]|uniref:Nitrate/nitrite transport system permease protein n=1 Tax=Aquimarina spongiae TaxID=570521 RepID=A0A1M6G8G3_9FLAO|nr:ABC transporter permease subunit [Aquimarina spongiae]SHJ06221.1 nitrate/nitrite transport system permease protein [Aquimarina spongiae]
MKDKSIHILNFVGLGFFEPAIRLAAGEEVKKNIIALLKKVLLPIVSVGLFLIIWHSGATYLYNVEKDARIEKALADRGEAAALEMETCIDSGDISCQPNTLPSPAQVWTAYKSLLVDHRVISEKKDAFSEKVAATNAKRKAQGLAPIKYTGRPSFVDQIFTSLKTVFAGFLLAFLIAVPIGIMLGLSTTLRSSVNWLIQIFKPVSPVVWLLLVFMIVKTLTKNSDSDSSFIISFISVGLCSMWATLVNTSMGVSSVDKDYINVAKVLQLSVGQKVFKIILPSSFPLIFTGLRITLSVAWMVLIAIELLAQSPGLGSFVWEEFQNGANDSNSKIIVAMFVIGIIGFLLDRLMLTIQKFVTFTEETA